MEDICLWDDYFRDIEKKYGVKIHKDDLKMYVSDSEYNNYKDNVDNDRRISVGPIGTRGNFSITFNTGRSTYSLIKQDLERVEIPLSEYIQFRSQ